MTSVKLSDGAAIDIDVTLSKGNAIARYGVGLPPLVIDIASLATSWNSPMADPGLSEASLRLAFKSPIQLGAESQLALGGDLGLRFQFYKPGKHPEDLPEELGLTTPENSVWVRLGLEVSVSPALESKHNDLSMGFKAGSTINIWNFRCHTASKEHTVGSCFSDLISGFVIPGDLRDLEALSNDGTTATLASGSGSLSISGKFPVTSSVNPLVSAELPLKMGTLGVQAGFSVTASASFEARGGYSVAAARDGDIVNLVFMRNEETEEGFKVSASTGIKASLGDDELLSALAGLISSEPKADAAELEAAGLPKETIQQIKKAIEFGIDRSLTAGLTMALGAGSGTKRLFAFRLTSPKLDGAERDAVHLALDGDVSGLLSVPQGGGVGVLANALDTIQSRGCSLRFNLLGILNTFSVARLIVEGSVLVEPETGDVVITDKITASRIRGTLLPFAADAGKLRALQASTFCFGAALMAVQGHVQPALRLSATVTYFELHSRTRRQVMKDNLDAVVALQLTSAAHAALRLNGSAGEFGRSIMLLDLGLGPQQCMEMFLDSNGAPYPDTYYETAGCEALRQLVRPGDPDDFRLQLVSNPAHWKRARDLGNPGLIAQEAWGRWFPKTADGLRQSRLAAADYQMISWWATAMALSAVCLARFLSFMNQNPGINWQDNGFKAAFATFTKALKKAVSLAKPDLFDNPWGLIATSITVQSRPNVTRSARILSDKLILELP